MFTKKSYMKKWMPKKPVHTGWSYLCSYVDAEKRHTKKFTNNLLVVELQAILIFFFMLIFS